MNRLIKESLEQLLQDTHDTRRLGRRIINLAGFLGTTDCLNLSASSWLGSPVC